MDTLDVKLSARTHLGDAGLNSFLRGGDPSPTRPSSLVGASIDSSPITQKSSPDRGSAYGGQRKFDISTLAGAEDILDGGRGEDSVGVTENPPPPRPIGGNPWKKISHPPPTHISTQGGVPTAKSPARPGSLRGRSWEDAATSRAPPLWDKNFIYPHPRRVPLANFLRGPGDTYIPRGEPLENLLAYPPPPRRTPRDQV